MIPRRLQTEKGHHTKEKKIKVININKSRLSSSTGAAERQRDEQDSALLNTSASDGTLQVPRYCLPLISRLNWFFCVVFK